MARVLACALAALISVPATVMAQSFDRVVSANILPGWRNGDGSHMAGLEIQLNPGWKTYWRAPGDAGVPPLFEWSGANIAGVEVIWPTPEVFSQNGMNSVGYKQTVVLPVRITPRDKSQAIRLDGDLNIGVCRDICVPQDLHVSAHLPAKGKRDARIAGALADRPLTAKEAGVRDVTCRISPTLDGLAIETRVDMPSAGGAEVMVIEAGDPQIWVAEAKTRRNGGTLMAKSEMMHVSGRAFVLDRSAIRVTVLGQRQAVDIKGCRAG
ncbi:protein-disulfide reductase DsbD domain-containing protein [Shimia biformata]|uniref:protein-disulfide reductase DsbD domain-containing protein n=1 Tax=Shimia biformata TaxID=1294299 RepID=UPI001951CD45|nr:protein-disulfide reductase DsbD domain-containing protein [Shimia biformata]